jgi:1A family penicillin-binding protein
VVLVTALAAAAAAQDPSAAYPPLPTGVSGITVMDSHGRYVGRILPQKRYWVGLNRIPAFLQQSLLAVEDARFYEHGGIDLRGIARALVTDVVKGRMAEGGSTITQQLIKNLYLTNERSIDRKVKEARMAMDFEKKYSKQQILEMYFNEIYFGNGAYGLSAATRLYFNKSPEELSQAECIALAGVPKNPAKYNPMGKPADVAGRRAVVVQRLLDLTLVTAQQAQVLRAQAVPALGEGQAPAYLAEIRAQLMDRYGPDIVEQGGLDVFAAMDLDLQKKADQALRDGVRRLGPDLQGALVCMDPATGDVLAAVGGVDGNQNSLNRAFASRRQPGSAIKPLIYAAALEKGITAGSIWNDTPATYDRGNGATWKPLNDGKELYGDLSLRQALAVSNNIIAVKLLDSIGVPYFVDFAGRMGLVQHAANGLSLALGTDDVTLKDLVQAYTPLAAGGTRAEFRTMLRIHDRRHDVWTELPPQVAPVLAPGAAYVATAMLKDVLSYGTAKSLRKFSLLHPSAGKTGTTSDHVDAWFVGYTPQMLTGIWVGRDQPRPGGKGFTGGGAAAPIWERFMARALAARPPVDFPRPDSVVTVSIDPRTGLAADSATENPHDEFYLSGTEPLPPGEVRPAAPEPQPPAIASPATEPPAPL